MQILDDRVAAGGSLPPRGETRTPPPGPGAEPWCQVVEHTDGFTVRFGGGDPGALKVRLESFRGAVPPQRRRWNAQTRTWWVDPAVERMLGSLSRWTARWFAAHRVQRATALGATAAVWASLPAGDDEPEGWVITADPKPAPKPAANVRQAAPAGGPWSSQATRDAQRTSSIGGTASGAGPASQPLPNTAPAVALDPLAAAYAELWLRPGAPWPVVRAAYRALAAVHHPDQGGSSAKMQDLNAAYALIERREDERSLPPAPPAPPAPPVPAGASYPAAPAEHDEDDGYDRWSL